MEGEHTTLAAVPLVGYVAQSCRPGSTACFPIV